LTVGEKRLLKFRPIAKKGTEQEFRKGEKTKRKCRGKKTFSHQKMGVDKG